MGSQQERYFYHSFPRPKINEDFEETVARGLKILTSIKSIGLLLAPEIVVWNTKANLGTPSPIKVPQIRISFTELSRGELPLHCKSFGPISLEFEIEDLRREGALPVIYAPQPRDAADLLTNAGSIMVGHLGHTLYLLQQLQTLSLHSDPAMALKLANNPEAHTVAPDYKLFLNNTDENGNIVSRTEILAADVQKLLQYVGFRNAPFSSMIGVLELTRSLFYPTDNERNDEALSYYRQREWRLTGGYNVNSTPRGRFLTRDEKDLISKIDPGFWNRLDSVDGKEISRIDRAQILNSFSNVDLVSRIRRVIVPREAEIAAKDIFGDKISIY